MKNWLCGLCLIISCSPVMAQLQGCPVNINFSSGSLTHWFAYTGNNQSGNGRSAIMQIYDSTVAAPAGTIGATSIPEYQLPAVSGIFVNTNAGTDIYGRFPKIPTINGYQYNYSILLGSTSISRSNPQSGNPLGGYIRGVSYLISVPAGPATTPYTMTYAYAMVLENGSHASKQQPMFSATLTTPDSIITCASPAYLLPTFGNTVGQGGGGATLDTAAALALGFAQSSLPSPNPDPNSNSGIHLYDVWTKGWREVTFDLSPYRGQQVTLTFEADNCVPGGHFAYAYIALRNTCGGLLISGGPLVCTNTNATFSIPALTGATYQWSVPNGWTITSGNTSNIITVQPGNQAGTVIAKEQNSCANLTSTLQVSPVAPPIPGNVTGNSEVCTGINNTILTLNGNTGNVVEWLSSTDGVNWSGISNTSTNYNAQNLAVTTSYKAVVETNAVCAADTSTSAVVTVDEKSVAGAVSPANTNICQGQNNNAVLTLSGNTGNVLNWQYSQNNSNWVNVVPANPSTVYNLNGVSFSAFYRSIVKNGVCKADTSTIAAVKLFNTQFPQLVIQPDSETICYGKSAAFTTTIKTGTQYAWTNTNSLINEGNGTIPSTPFVINAIASPLQSTYYILNVINAGCPNALTDTFLVKVVPNFTVSAGNDTTIVAYQPLQLQATSTDITNDSYSWSPGTFLNNSAIADPIATFSDGADSMTYVVTATDASGCSSNATLHIKVYNVPASIYVPTAFTPNGDGLNDIFRPITLGMKSLTLFNIYNRWGQLIFSTSQIGKGWDGTVNGEPQPTGNYVWIANGIDYTGKYIQKKGNVVLIR